MKKFWPDSSIKNLLYRGTDPFEDYLPNESLVDMETWNTGGAFKFLIPYLRPRLILEVGTWKGSTAIHMATLLNNYGIHSEIVCIDTFCGSEVHWLGHLLTESKEMGITDESLYAGLKIKKGRPTLFDIFMNNCVCAKATSRITPFPCSSESAFFALQAMHARPDLIYIDAGHEYEAVSRDLNLFSTILSDKGVILLDDYGTAWPGVDQAVLEFASKNLNWKFYGTVGKAILTRAKITSLTTIFLCNDSGNWRHMESF
jgi:hypothetical protein